ncbi:MAG: hypothetical protein HYT22_00650 [Candidatus Niyogibacteria bacterium]|nr:hypothetical protein [Candidatus Niyogibacteria bacterium]
MKKALKWATIFFVAATFSIWLAGFVDPQISDFYSRHITKFGFLFKFELYGTRRDGRGKAKAQKSLHRRKNDRQHTPSHDREGIFIGRHRNIARALDT